MRKKAGYQPKKRNAHSRERRSVILLATEGKNQTETQYFRDFSGEFNKIVRFVPGNYTDPVNMVQALIQTYRKNCHAADGDIGYCLIDSDFAPAKDEKIATADQLAAKQDAIRVLVSSPCFEVWFLCHYHASARKYASNQEVIKELQKYHPGYTKSTERMFEQTKNKLISAISNAEQLWKACQRRGEQPHTVAFAPSTEISELVQKLMN